jgi:hypothetical protein
VDLPAKTRLKSDGSSGNWRTSRAVCRRMSVRGAGREASDGKILVIVDDAGDDDDVVVVIAAEEDMVVIVVTVAIGDDVEVGFNVATAPPRDNGSAADTTVPDAASKK